MWLARKLAPSELDVTLFIRWNFPEIFKGEDELRIILEGDIIIAIMVTGRKRARNVLMLLKYFKSKACVGKYLLLLLNR